MAAQTMKGSIAAGGLEGMAALITGGGSGIGAACAERLAADGAAVTICGHTEARLDAAAEKIAPLCRGGGSIETIVADVTVEEVAHLARFLIGPESRWITGVAINVDGGHALRRGPDFGEFVEPTIGQDALTGGPPNK